MTNLRHSLYWDDFERRVDETVEAIKTGVNPPVRRVAVFITDRCNFHCKYCNSENHGNTLTQAAFERVLEKYGDTAIIHITGGEPSVVPWLYPFIRAYGDRYRFHLNTNGFIPPPSDQVKRLKVSLDHQDATYWDALVGVRHAFNLVSATIWNAMHHTVTSITYTMTHENYRNAPEFAKFANEAFPKLYAVFFSIYKGVNPTYDFTPQDADIFFAEVLPDLEAILPDESLALLRETVDEKRRLIQGVRFPANDTGMCYLSMSERVISPTGDEFTCSHLYRDGVYRTAPLKHEKCLYGCNRRLVQFNEEVERRLLNG